MVTISPSFINPIPEVGIISPPLPIFNVPPPGPPTNIEVNTINLLLVVI